MSDTAKMREDIGMIAGFDILCESGIERRGTGGKTVDPCMDVQVSKLGRHLPCIRERTK
jgi:hypothetical protein